MIRNGSYSGRERRRKGSKFPNENGDFAKTLIVQNYLLSLFRFPYFASKQGYRYAVVKLDFLSDIRIICRYINIG